MPGRYQPYSEQMHGSLENWTNELILALEARDAEIAALQEAEVTQDFVIQGPLIKHTGASSPTFSKFQDDGAGSAGVFAYKFATGALNDGWFSIAFPVYAKRSVVFIPKLHYAPDDGAAGNIRWGFEYSVTNANAVYPSTAIDTVISATPGVAFQRTDVIFPTISAGIGPGSEGLFRVFRDGAHADDTYAGNAFLVNFTLTLKVYHDARAT